MKTHSFDVRVQRPFTKGVSFLVAYAFQRDRIQNWLERRRAVRGADDRRQERLGVAAGQPGAARAPADRRVHLADSRSAANRALLRRHARGARLHRRRLAVHHRRSASTPAARCSSTTRYARERQPEARQPDARPVVRHLACSPRSRRSRRAPTRCTTTGSTARASWFVDMTLTKIVPRSGRATGSRRGSRPTTRSTTIVWDSPDTTFGSANFGKVTRKRDRRLRAARSRSACGSCSSRRRAVGGPGRGDSPAPLSRVRLRATPYLRSSFLPAARRCRRTPILDRVLLLCVGGAFDGGALSCVGPACQRFTGGGRSARIRLIQLPSASGGQAARRPAVSVTRPAERPPHVHGRRRPATGSSISRTRATAAADTPIPDVPVRSVVAPDGTGRRQRASRQPSTWCRR